MAYFEEEICFASNEDTVDIIHVSDHSTPYVISVLHYEGDQYTHQGWLTDDKKFFLVDDELDEYFGFSNNTLTLIFNVTDLEDPSFVKIHVADTAAIDHNQYVVGDYVYQANYRAGLRILSLEKIEKGKLVEVGYFDTFPDSDSNDFNGAWSNYPFFDSGIVIISDIEQGLFVVKPDLEDVTLPDDDDDDDGDDGDDGDEDEDEDDNEDNPISQILRIINELLQLILDLLTGGF